eukprot:TRINITY_DN3944_c0_g1_i2.p3 TRINITY_DN3944_c0_g1~~TRINITY_DN3944_c0_g1_i2.p3  ORF type:complete len:125 (+),score=42.86 TRINITY_DN3944_c0_g1_i2:319-693(+)
MRKGRMPLDVKELDVADKVQLFNDILFYELESLYHFIEADMQREGALSADEVAAEMERLKLRDAAPQRKPAPKGYEPQDLPGSDPASAPMADPTVQPGGVGCFLCGTMDHDEKQCKYSPQTKAG